jgi:exodeoxyribonuclease III
MGDFNISPADIDIGIGESNRKRWLRDGKTSFQPVEREWLDGIKAWGLVPTATGSALPGRSNDRFSWFDYRSRGFERDPKRGLRIDHILVTPAGRAVRDAGIDYDLRGMERPSDHAPYGPTSHCEPVRRVDPWASAAVWTGRDEPL